MAHWRRITGAAGLVVGAVAASAGAAVAAERIAVSRLRSRAGKPGAEPFTALRGRELTVLASDGVPLHVEIDGPDTAPVTIIFCHGYTLNQDCWCFQRRDLAGHRLVLWDQRDHGRSGRSGPGSATLDQLGADLKAVIDAAAPGPAPVVLVGHSMGGMTIMALAGQHPGMFGTKVAGAVLINTAASGLQGGSPWMPGPVRPALARALPLVLHGAAGGRAGRPGRAGPPHLARLVVPRHAADRVRRWRGQPVHSHLPGTDDQGHAHGRRGAVRPDAVGLRQARLAAHARQDPGGRDGR